jgi:hypothetical protein
VQGPWHPRRSLRFLDGSRHLGVGGVGHAAPAVDLDRAQAAVARSEQRIALRGHFFLRHERGVVAFRELELGCGAVLEWRRRRY